MPSKKPQFVIRTEQEILDKIAYIANQNERSSTQEIVHLIKKHIKAYEAEHGEIKTETPTGFSREKATLKKFKAGEMNFTDMLKESAQNAKKDYWTDNK